MNNLISIITPSYNTSLFLDDCIKSVLDQSYTNWEMLIVDDASHDNSKSIILQYSKSDNRIKPLFLDKNIGAAASRNIALSNAKGDYIAFLDSDDLWVKEKLAVELKFMIEENINFSFSSYHTISKNGLVLGKKITAPSQISYNGYLKDTIIGCLTVMLKRSFFKDLQMPLLRSSHDMALWLNLMRSGENAFGINQSLAKYRIVDSSNTSNKFKAVLDVWRVYREHEKLSFIFSVYNFIFYIYNAIKKRF